MTKHHRRHAPSVTRRMGRGSRRRAGCRSGVFVALAVALGFGLLPIVQSSADAATTDGMTLVSESVNGGAGNQGSGFTPAVSREGRYVAFGSFASDLVESDTNGLDDIFVRDVATGETMLVSRSSGGELANGFSLFPDISGDGRFVVFQSHASNLGTNDTNGTSDVFLHDRATGATTLISRSLSGAAGNASSGSPKISHNGRYVVFLSRSTDLVPVDVNGNQDVFAYDRLTEQTRLVSVTTDELPSDADSTGALTVSASGRYVGFVSRATNLVGGDTNNTADIFVRDRLDGVTIRASVNSPGDQANGPSSDPDLTAGGGAVAFQSMATNLVDGDTNQRPDIFVHHFEHGTTVRVSLSTSGTEGNHFSQFPAISADGRYVSFQSISDNLVAGDTNGTADVFVRDRVRDLTQRISETSGGIGGDDLSQRSAITPDGRYVVFESWATNLTPDSDTNDNGDIYHLDRIASLASRTASPMIAAHGIGSDQQAMQPALELAHEVVPSLPTSSFSIDTSPTGSPWLNGRYIAAKADELIGTSSQKVNVLAHSKGGLDARVALWEKPELFHGLGMLATPNAGSKGADKLCAILRTVGAVPPQFEDMGPCGGPADALYTLQTSYMEEFNRVVRDWNVHGHSVSAGDCTASSLACAGLDSLAIDCEFGGDNAVCVESAFARARNVEFPSTADDPDRIHDALFPIFDLNHTAMRQDACPITRVLAPLYHHHNFGNPWVDPTAPRCDQLDAPSASTKSTSSGVAASQLDAPEVPSDGDSRTASTESVPDTEQTLSGAASSPGSSLVVPLDSESGTVLQAEIYAPAGVAVTPTIRDELGLPVDDYAVESGQVLGQAVTVIRVDRPVPFAYELSVAVDSDAAIGIVTLVDAGDVEARSSVTRVTGDTAEVEVLLDGVSDLDAPDYTVTATFDGTGAPPPTVLTPTGSTEGGYRFAAQVTLPTGSLVNADIDIDGPSRRRLRDSITLPDGSGQIGALQAEAIVDTDSDGFDDILRLDVDVTASVADEYQLVTDLVAPDGTIVTSAAGTATLASGAGTVEVEVDLPSLVSSGLDSPYTIGDAVLTRGSEQETLVDEKDDVGVTGAVSLDSLALEHPVLTQPTVESVDPDADGVNDVLRFSTTARVPSAADYYLEGHLVGPDGAVVEVVRRIMALPGGATDVDVDFDRWVVHQGGSGQYTLAGASLTSLVDISSAGTAPTVTTSELDIGDWAFSRCTLDEAVETVEGIGSDPGNGGDTGRLVDDFECVVDAVMGSTPVSP